MKKLNTIFKFTCLAFLTCTYAHAVEQSDIGDFEASVNGYCNYPLK